MHALNTSKKISPIYANIHTQIVNKHTPKEEEKKTNSPTISNEINIRKKLVKKFDIHSFSYQYYINMEVRETERQRQIKILRKENTWHGKMARQIGCADIIDTI